MTAQPKTEMEATSARVSPALVTFRPDPAHDLWAACEAGDWEAASRVNLELATEFPFVDKLRVVSLLWIGRAWDDDASRRAGAAWANSIRQGREKLAGFAKRLEAANPIEGAKARLAGLGARLESARPKPEPQQEVPAAEEWLPRKLGSAPVLGRQTPLANAKAFVLDKLYLHKDAEGDGKLGTYFFHGNWWEWNGRFYERMPDQRLRDKVCHYLDFAAAQTDKGQEPFQPKPEHVNHLIDLLRSRVGIDDRSAPPRWMDERASPTAENLLVFRNCLVDATTGKMHSLTPDLWVHDGVDFDYDPAAQCPEWDHFLETLFPDDVEARITIEEQLGYGMTFDNRFEKAALWKGPPRSGRGTLAHIQELLVGASGHVALNIHDWTKTENSRANLIGKKVGIFHDLRLKPAKTYGMTGFDPGGIDHQSTELLLKIIAGDTTAIPVKYKPDPWQGKSRVKIILITNEVPNLMDQGGALLSRFVMVEFTQSFLGRENPDLKNRILPAELSGIANRCLVGYHRLLKRGHFLQPKSGLGLLKSVQEKINPLAAFMNDCWERDTNAEAEGKGPTAETIHNVFCDWCRANDRHDLILRTPRPKLLAEIYKLPEWEWIKSFKPHGQVRRYPGLKRKAKHDV